MPLWFVLALFHPSTDTARVSGKGLWKGSQVSLLFPSQSRVASLQLAVKRCQNHETMSKSCILLTFWRQESFRYHFKNVLLGGKRLQKSWSVYIYRASATARMLSRLKYQLCLFHGESKHAFLISSDITWLCLIIHTEIVKKEPELTRLNESRSRLKFVLRIEKCVTSGP